MMNRFMLGAYWDARSDSIEECTENVRRFFTSLADANPLLGQWYQKGRSRKDALKRRVDCLDPGILRELLLKGRQRRDVAPREVMEELGFSLSLWNGAEPEEAEASVSISCGSYSRYVGNNVLVRLPHYSENAAWVQRAALLLASTAEIWQPRWAGIMSRQAMRERDFGSGRPFVDWMVYVPRSVPPVPPPARVEVLPGLGSLIVVQPDPPTGNDPEELSRIRQVESILTA